MSPRLIIRLYLGIEDYDISVAGSSLLGMTHETRSEVAYKIDKRENEVSSVETNVDKMIFESPYGISIRQI